MPTIRYASGLTLNETLEQVSFAIDGDMIDTIPRYMVTVRVEHRADGSVPVGIEVKRPDETDEPLSSRDVRRLPLDRIVSAALAAASGPRERRGEDEWFSTISKALAPPGRPERNHSAEFYKGISVFYRATAAKGLSPAQELARQKKVTRGTADQWIYRTRELGFLDPSPRSWKKQPKKPKGG